ncbi:MAG: hypothetical protein GY906_37230 [bacterium]|nr:hypothetical protein [bacterium]
MLSEEKRDIIGFMALVIAAVSVATLIHIKDIRNLNREISVLEDALQTDVVVCIDAPTKGWPPITKRLCQTAEWREQQMDQLMNSNASCLRARLSERQTRPTLRTIFVPGGEND